MILTTIYKFTASHSHRGLLAEDKHSHEFTLEVKITGKPNDEGFVIDFLKIQELVEERALAQLKEGNLDQLMSFPTSENIAIWVWQQLAEVLPLYEVTVREIPTLAATYRGPDSHV